MEDPVERVPHVGPFDECAIRPTGLDVPLIPKEEWDEDLDPIQDVEEIEPSPIEGAVVVEDPVDAQTKFAEVREVALKHIEADDFVQYGAMTEILVDYICL